MPATIPSNLSNMGAVTSNVPKNAIASTATKKKEALDKIKTAKEKLKAARAAARAAIKAAKEKLNATKASIKAAKEEAKALVKEAKATKEKTKAALDTLKNLKGISKSQVLLVLSSVIVPILSKFINAEKVANAICNKLIKDARKKLKDKGRFEVNDGAIVFVPKDKADYQIYKNNFDSKVKKLQTIINTIKKILDALVTLTKVIKTLLAAAKLLLILLKAKLAASTGSPAYLAVQLEYNTIGPPLEEKIDQYIIMISFISSTLQIYKKLVDALKVKIDTLSFTITTLPDALELQTIIETTSPADAQTLADAQTQEEFESGDRTYIIKLISTPSGAIQAVAYDSFSMMKITQTAPSKNRTGDQLLDEIKQILK